MHENELRELVSYFYDDIPVVEKQPAEPSATAPTAPASTKVIVENLELLIGAGALAATNTVRLKAKQLFFVSQPFQAGRTEGNLFLLFFPF